MQPETIEERDARIRKAQSIGGLPSFVTEPVTDDELAALHAAAAKRLSSGAEKNPTERYLAYWETVRSNAEAQIDAAENTGQGALLTEALIRLGRLTDAADAAVLYAPERLEEIAELATAIGCDDEEECGCDDFQATVEHPISGLTKLVWLPRYRPTSQVYRADLEMVCHVVKCLRCGHANARPQLPVMLQLMLDAEKNHPEKGDGCDFDVLVPVNA